jgi:serine/threonine-protein kinase
MNLEGTTLDSKYEVLRLIGQGGMGAVYEARQSQVHRLVAVKLLSSTLAHEPDAVVRFKREAEAAGRIGHDNICEVFDFGIAPHGSPYFVMPRLTGCSLSLALKEGGAMAPARVCDIIGQTLAGLAAAHDQGIIHRDLKPDNIFLTTVGGRADFVKILDFGISKVMRKPSSEDAERSLTKTGSVLGTPAYMAPEQARGAKDVDHRVDIYAVGVILYEMLTAKKPFDGDSFNEILWKIWNDSIPPPSTHRPDLAPEVEDVILRAIDRDRDRRFPTAEAFRHALTRAVDDVRAGTSRSTMTTSGSLPPVESSHSDATAPTAPQQAARPPAVPTPAGGTLGGRSITVRRSRRHGVTAAVVAAVLAVGIAIFLLLLRDGAAPSATDAADVDHDRTLTYSTAATTADGSATAVALAPPQPAPERHVAEAVDAPDVSFPAPAAVPRDPPTLAADGTAQADILTVRLTLTDLPPAASILVDGEPTEGPEIDVPIDARIRLVVLADGYDAWEEVVTADASKSVSVRMPRTDGTRRRDVGSSRDDRADAGRPIGGMVTTFGEIP